MEWPLPRLKPIHSQRLALVEAGTQDDYPHLKEVLGKAINWEVIRQQYDMMVKYATALKTGTADADALLRRFTRSNLQHSTYQGLHKLFILCIEPPLFLIAAGGTVVFTCRENM